MEAVDQPFRMVKVVLLLRPGGWNAVGCARWDLLRDQPEIGRELAEEIACGQRVYRQ